MNSVTSLVTIQEGTPLADSRLIAKELGIDPQNFLEMIADYEEEVSKDFGLIRFETEKTTEDSQGRGRPQKYALLTEEQSYVYLAYSKNTEQARTCKRKLVKEFITAKQMIAQFLQGPTNLSLSASSLDVRYHLTGSNQADIKRDQAILSHLQQADALLRGKRTVHEEKRHATPVYMLPAKKSLEEKILAYIEVNQQNSDKEKIPTVRNLCRYIKDFSSEQIRTTIQTLLDQHKIEGLHLGKAFFYQLVA